MKKFILLVSPIVITACSTPIQQSTVPMDMQAVHDYQQRILTKQTVDKNAQPNNEALNQSDRRSKSTISPIRPLIYPSLGVGYHHRWRHRYW